MKKITQFFIVLTLSITFTSCSSDDSSSDSAPSLIGTWTGVSVDATGTASVEFQGFPVTVDFVGDSYDENFTLTFSENPNVVSSDGTYSMAFDASLAGQTIFSETFEDIMLLDESEWSREGDELTFTAQGQTMTATIVALTNNALTLEIDTTQMFQGNEADINLVVVLSR